LLEVGQLAFRSPDLEFYSSEVHRHD